MDSNLHIVFCAEHHNPLGIVRSLGENGIRPIGIIIKGNKKITSKSRYLSKVYYVNDIEEGYRLLINEFRNNKLKSFVYTADDATTGYLDNHYDELKDYFYFYNAGEQGRLNYYMDKINICNEAKKLRIRKCKNVEGKKRGNPFRY